MNHYLSKWMYNNCIIIDKFFLISLIDLKKIKKILTNLNLQNLIIAIKFSNLQY